MLNIPAVKVIAFDYITRARSISIAVGLIQVDAEGFETEATPRDAACRRGAPRKLRSFVRPSPIWVVHIRAIVFVRRSG